MINEIRIVEAFHDGKASVQVIKESMRMYPVAGSGIGRYADRDIELGGYLIPKGTEVAVCLHTMHMVPWNFPDPDTFRADRWLGGADGAPHPPCLSRHF